MASMWFTSPLTSAAPASFTDDLICSVCNYLFQEPVLLRCGHSFCRVCVSGTGEGQLRGTCPICMSEFSRGKFTPIKTLANLVERVKGDSPGKGGKEHCRAHLEKLKLFCVDDGIAICVVCRDTVKHSKHRFLPIQDAVGMYKKQLAESLDPLTSVLKKLQDLEKKQENAIETNKKAASEIKSNISSTFEKLYQALKAEEKHTLTRMTTEKNACLKETEEQLSKVKEEWLKIQKAMDAAQNKLCEQDPQLFLTGVKSCLETCAEEQKRVPAPLVSGSQAQHLPQGPLEYTLWKQVMHAIFPAPSHVTLDPRTAHHSLVVSEDRTSVRHRGRGMCPSGHPARFNKAPGVLGVEGFNSGLHYWVVDAKGASMWTLGVSEDSRRWTGNTQLPSCSGIFALQRNGDTFVALESQPKTLPMAAKACQIGVCLEYEEGLVSFYNAEDLSLIHTLKFQSSAVLYPYLNPSTNSTQPLSLL
ncbi:zinc-binding protein A33-like isoform X1 [Pleurodeles waltl]